MIRPTQNFNVKDITITGSGGLSVSLLNLALELNIYEDIHTAFITGSLVIGDGIGLIGKLPIVGQEKLSIKFTAADETLEYSEDSFIVTGVESRKATRGQSVAYVLTFIHSDFITANASSTISKAYDVSGKVGDPLATQVWFDISAHTEKGLVGYDIDTHSSVPHSEHDTHIIVPSFKKPFDAVKWCLNKFYESPHLFYMNQHGYHIVSLTSLNESPASGTIVFEPKTRNNQLNRMNASAYDIISLPNVNHLHNSGQLGASFITHSLIDKATSVIEWNYLDEYPSVGHTNSSTHDKKSTGQLINQSGDADGHKYEKNKQAQVILTNGNGIGANCSDYPIARVDPISKMYKATNGNFINQMNQIVIGVTLPGDPTMVVGETMNFDLPSNETYSREGGFIKDKMLAGKYLVTKVRHCVSIAESSYNTTLELSSDSYASTIPTTNEAKKTST